jgi:hypothetical protein
MKPQLTLTLALAAITLFSTASSNTNNATQQNEPHLINMLALIPDTPNVHFTEEDFLPVVSYIDYEAIVAMRPGAPQVNGWEELQLLEDSEDEDKSASFGLWRSAISGIHSGPDFIWRNENEVNDLMGFDFFEIERGVNYSYATNGITIFDGDFDEEAIGIAFSNRGYIFQNFDGGTLWCGLNGCDGTSVDIQNTNNLNPFGGDLGRVQPLLILDNYLISSPSFENIEIYSSIINHSQPTLADNPYYRAAANSITDRGTLIQVQFFDPSHFIIEDAKDLAREIASRETALRKHSLGPPNEQELQEIVEKIVEYWQEHYTSIPLYSLVALADIVEGNKQVTIIALVYDTVDDAHVGSEILHRRLIEYPFTVLGYRQLTEALDDRQAIIEAPYVYTDVDSGKSVAIVSLHAPMPSQNPLFIGGKHELYPMPSTVFRLFVAMLYRGESHWLTVFSQWNS